MRRVVLVATVAVAGALLGALPPASAPAARALAMACRTPDPAIGLHPRRVHGLAPRELRAILGVLRRPAAPGDALPRSESPLGSDDLRSVYVDRVRLLGVLPDGTHVFLFPGRTRRPPRLTRACLHSFSRRERRVVQRELHMLARRARHGVVDVASVSDDGSSTSTAGGFDAGAIKRGQIFSVTSSIFRPLTTTDGVVPDGVAQVTVRAPGGESATVAVANNFYVAQLAVRLREDSSFAITWRSAGGAVIKTISMPVLGSGSSGSSSSGTSYGGASGPSG